MSITIAELVLQNAAVVDANGVTLSLEKYGGHDHALDIVLDYKQHSSDTGTVYFEGCLSPDFSSSGVYAVPVIKADGTTYATSYSFTVDEVAYIQVQGYHKYLRARYDVTGSSSITVTAYVGEEV